MKDLRNIGKIKRKSAAVSLVDLNLWMLIKEPNTHIKQIKYE